MPKVYNKKDNNIPEGAVYVGRPTKWGNPFIIGKDGGREEVVRKYKEVIQAMGRTEKSAFLAPLVGKDLVCWCAPEACHADVLMEIAND